MGSLVPGGVNGMVPDEGGGGTTQGLASAAKQAEGMPSAASLGGKALKKGVSAGNSNQLPPSNAQNVKQGLEKKAGKALNKGAEKGARAVGDSLGGWGKAAEAGMKQVNKYGDKTLNSVFGDNEEAKLGAKLAPFFIVPLSIIFLILIVINILMAILGGHPEAGVAGSQLVIAVTGPDQAKNGDELPYQINVAYGGTAQDIIITNKIPEGTDYVSSVPNATYDVATRTASWSMKAAITPAGAGVSNLNTNLTITLRSTRDNITLINMVQGAVIGGVAAGTDPNAADPNINTGL